MRLFHKRCLGNYKQHGKSCDLLGQLSSLLVIKGSLVLIRNNFEIINLIENLSEKILCLNRISLNPQTPQPLKSKNTARKTLAAKPVHPVITRHTLSFQTLLAEFCCCCCLRAERRRFFCLFANSGTDLRMASDQIDGEVKTFKSLGLCDQLVEAVAKLDWTNPTPIQVEAIPHALEGSSISLIHFPVKF